MLSTLLLAVIIASSTLLQSLNISRLFFSISSRTASFKFWSASLLELALTCMRKYSYFLVGFSFDYSRQVDTTDPSYYKWTQWIFLKLFEKGLAYKDKTEVNYCNNCRVVLANEESQGGKCDRCDGEVIQKEKEVWMLKITDYAEKLLAGLNEVDFPERVRVQQENWIGKSTGAEVDFKLKDIDDKLTVYTTRPDTMFGVTFMVIAPEHPMIKKYADRIKRWFTKQLQVMVRW